jgi:uncharacterized phiE125 gp8 family phage protein
MRTVEISRAATAPVSIAALKEHLRIEAGYTGDDAYITALGVAAVNWAEGFTRRKFASALVRLYLDSFPQGSDALLLPFGKVTQVTQIIYAESATESVTLTGATSSPAGADYQEALGSDSVAYVAPLDGESWPCAGGKIEPVVIEYLAGYGDPATPGVIPAAIIAALKVKVADYYERRSSDDIKNPATEAAAQMLQPYVLPVW